MLKQFLLNGRLAAIFFLISFISTDTNASEIYGQIDSAINRGLLTDKYWRSQSLSTSSEKVLAYSDSKIGALIEIADQKIFVERRKIATLSTNTNSLLAASNADNALDSQTYGNYPLNASLKKFEFDAVGLVWGELLEQSNLRWSLAPKLLRLNSFSTGEGQGVLELTPTSQRLNGTVDRQGMSSYGFTTDPSPTQIGIGASVDVQLIWKYQNFMFDFDALNLASHIPTSGTYYNQRSYQVSTQSGSLVFSKTPSLTGIYGQADLTLHLPKILKSTISHQATDSNWSQYLGAISLHEGVIPWGGIGYIQGDSIFKVKSYALNNLFLMYEKKNFIISNLGFEVTVGTAFQGKSQVALTALRYIF